MRSLVSIGCPPKRAKPQEPGQTFTQRERFRLRVQELENENSQQSQNIAGLSQEIENLRLDNVKLYEKIKFLQKINIF